MDINDFKRILTAFADEPSDVDVRLGKIVAQIRDDLIDAEITYSSDAGRNLLVMENGQRYAARSWLINRVARLPQLADRIISTAPVVSTATSSSPFVVPCGTLSPDLSSVETAHDDAPIGDVVETLLTKATNPLPGATSVIYITSDAGEGKTTVINHVARVQAERYKAKIASSLIVPIPLSGRAFLTFDDAVIAALVNKLRFSYLYFDAFIELVRLGVVVPAFDGYEEMLVEGSKGEAISALGNLIQSLNSSGMIFIAARKAFFEYVSFKTQARLLDAIGDRSASFSRVAISRWTREQFIEYGHLRRAPAPAEIYETVAARLGGEHPLLTRAVLVRRLFDIASDCQNASDLAALLGTNPHDYFFIFVNAIVEREASEKWLARVSGEIMEPLLDVDEHHQLLSLIAQEMWQSSANSLRLDILDVLVDIFCEERRKSAAAIRQIRERLRQHSLLSSDASRAQSLSFDHEDFQNFYLGEGLGLLLERMSRIETQAFLSVNLVPSATIEQAVQYLRRNGADLKNIFNLILSINELETGFSFCKENCGALAIRIVECISEQTEPLVISGLFFGAAALTGRTLCRVTFENSHFQPTSVSKSTFVDVAFRNCEFERLEMDNCQNLSGCTFYDCHVDSLIAGTEADATFDPALIRAFLTKADATIDDDEHVANEGEDFESGDIRLKLLERFLRIFLRSTSVGDSIVRLRLGKSGASTFFDQVLPALMGSGILEEVPWMGQGVQHRYKLSRSMSEINRALERSGSNFDSFITEISGVK